MASERAIVRQKLPNAHMQMSERRDEHEHANMETDEHRPVRLWACSPSCRARSAMLQGLPNLPGAGQRAGLEEL